MRIGILGGSFDPPHAGHVSIGQESIEENLVDKVWVMPCPERPGKELSSVEHRITMCNLAFQNNEKLPGFEVSDFQIRKGLTTTIETYDALVREDRIKSLFNKTEPNTFSFIIGMDCALEIQHWYKHDELIERVPFIVFNRKGVQRPSGPQWFLKPPHGYIVFHKQGYWFISSSDIRGNVRNGNYYYGDSHSSRNIMNYIEKNKLYLNQKSE